MAIGLLLFEPFSKRQLPLEAVMQKANDEAHRTWVNLVSHSRRVFIELHGRARCKQNSIEHRYRTRHACWLPGLPIPQQGPVLHSFANVRVYTVVSPEEVASIKTRVSNLLHIVVADGIGENR